MKKTLIIVAVVVVAAIAGLYFYGRSRKGNPNAGGGGELPELPPASEPPQGGQGLQSTETGAGAAAIERRVKEILRTDGYLPIQSEIQSGVNILTGVTPSKVPYYSQNISRAPVNSPKQVPLNVNASVKQALEGFSGIIAGVDNSVGAAAMSALRAQNGQLMSAVGTCFVGQPELDNQDQFNKQVMCQGYIDCGKKYKEMGGKFAQGSENVQRDMAKMSGAWLNAINAFEAAVKIKAINDLRNAGWRFVGYDA